MGPPESVRIGSDVREQLITMKRRTGVMNWNVLCRWALCRSLAEPTAPPTTSPNSDTAVEMTWKTFSGAAGDLYWWLIKQRARELGLPLDEQALHAQLRAHITRGTQYLVGDANMRDTPDLVALLS
ncbi:DNA sulfur modification protein DndE [Nonomuraea composti]